MPGWGERYCNNVNYAKNNVIFEPPSMRACSSTSPKQNQDFVKEHNRTPFKNEISPFGVDFEICNFVDLFMPKHTHYTLTKIQKVKKHNRIPLKLKGTYYAKITFISCLNTVVWLQCVKTISL